jgi:hypothetical protein
MRFNVIACSESEVENAVSFVICVNQTFGCCCCSTSDQRVDVPDTLSLASAPETPHQTARVASRWRTCIPARNCLPLHDAYLAVIGPIELAGYSH